MKELVDKKELLWVMEEKFCWCCPNVESGRCGGCEIKKCMDFIDCEVEARSDWIPISKKLPEYDGTYLITLLHEGWNEVIWASFHKELPREAPPTWGYWNGPEFRKIENWSEIGAWMHMPEPYEPSRAMQKMEGGT